MRKRKSANSLDRLSIDKKNIITNNIQRISLDFQQKNDYNKCKSNLI